MTQHSIELVAMAMTVSALKMHKCSWIINNLWVSPLTPKSCLRPWCVCVCVCVCHCTCVRACMRACVQKINVPNVVRPGIVMNALANKAHKQGMPNSDMFRSLVFIDCGENANSYFAEWLSTHMHEHAIQALMEYLSSLEKLVNLD